MESLSQEEFKKKATRIFSADDFPCLKESTISAKCLEDNYYDNTKCSKEFKNYNECQKFWNNIKRQRAKRGIQPSMPMDKEREKIMEAYKKGKITYTAEI